MGSIVNGFNNPGNSDSYSVWALTPFELCLGSTIECKVCFLTSNVFPLILGEEMCVPASDRWHNLSPDIKGKTLQYSVLSKWSPKETQIWTYFGLCFDSLESRKQTKIEKTNKNEDAKRLLNVFLITYLICSFQWTKWRPFTSRARRPVSTCSITRRPPPPPGTSRAPPLWSSPRASSSWSRQWPARRSGLSCDKVMSICTLHLRQGAQIHCRSAEFQDLAPLDRPAILWWLAFM